jgi:nucleoside-diphosphate-sugar epimerase
MMSRDPSSTRVLVTGAGGFIALHCILQLQEQGYRVRGTLRNMGRAPHVRAALAEHGQPGEGLEFCHADLLQDEGWREAVNGCDFVLHVASPLPLQRPKHEDELLMPAREGTLRVLRAAAGAGVRRVVLTSSLAAVGLGHDATDRVLTEADWSRVDRPIGPYPKAKTLAERAAWAFVAGPENTGQLELAAINPGDVLGPLLDREQHMSAQTIHSIMGRGAIGVPRLWMPLVDVRDVAAAHLAAMTVPEAAGQRFCCLADTLSMREIALILQSHFAGRGYRISSRVWPDVVVRLVGLSTPGVWIIEPRLGKTFTVSNEHIKAVLGWQPRSPEEAVVSMAESMVRLGMV